MISCSCRRAGLLFVISYTVPALLSATPQDAERAAVYAAALEYLFVTDTTRQLVVSPRTSPDGLTVERLASNPEPGRPRIPLLLDTAAARPETWRDYVAHNREPEKVPTFNLSVPVEFEESPRFARREGTSRPVLVDFPRAEGHVWLSGIGFDSARHEAIVSVFQSCGALCGFGGLLVLQRAHGNVWIVRTQLAFIQS